MTSTRIREITAASARLRPLLEEAYWEGCIAATFQTSLLLTGPHEALLHVHGGPRLVSPFSLRLDSPLSGVLRQLTLQPGVPVYKTGQCLEIPGSLRLWLSNVSYYSSPRPGVAEISPMALQVAQHTLHNHGRQGGINAIPQANAMMTTMWQALADGDLKRMAEVACRLVGLGPGLTPAGDDFLVGWLRGLWLMVGNSVAIHDALRSLCRSLVPDVARRTTHIGATFIRYGLEGEFAEILDQAIVALSSPSSPQAIAHTLRQLMAQGKTSGTDTTAGLLSCLGALSHYQHRQRGRPCQSGTLSAGAHITIPSP